MDGSEGKVYPGAVPVVVRRSWSTSRAAERGCRDADGLVDAVARAMEHADRVRRLGVRANADTAEDAPRARRFGAEGIGLCRTEHMFLGDRRELVEAMILARTDAERERALTALLPLQRQDFTGILEAMDGLPVTVRLLDPPLHEFLPDRTELAVRLAAAEAHGSPPSEHDADLLDAVNRMHEENPMLGLRGVRLGLVGRDWSPCRYGRSPRRWWNAGAQAGIRERRSWSR
ncbi:Pyruvate, phosphate dikinase OS=Streptomyces tendae OX=1932 GN=GUR47_03370 PE=3 SV=1 [Streptomyces tendae]